MIAVNLRAGVPLESIGESEPIAGEIDGESVLLFRRGNEVFAIGGTCTHYGGPLADGVVSGDVVRCPWHHACFDIRTGSAIAAPALNPVPSWRTEIREGRVFVLEKIERAPLDTESRPVSNPGSVVIVGAGAAGSAAAEMLRRLGFTGAIALVDPDPDAPYDRPNLSKDYLAGDAPEEWIPLRPAGFYQEHGIDRIVERVISIDASTHTVRLADGRSLPYGALLLATGAAPIRPNIPGGTLPNAHVLRSLSDCRFLIDAIGKARHVVVAGASFIGMEAASALRKRAVRVTVVAPEAVPFVKVLGNELGSYLHSLHRTNGVDFELGHTIQEVHADRVVLNDGRVLPCEAVLFGIGVRPVLELAAAAGLTIDNGVVVNEYLETSVSGIFAAGDIAQFPIAPDNQSGRIEHWVVAQRQGQTAARNILGLHQPFTSVPFFWTRQHEVSVAYVGHARSWDATVASGNANDGDYQVSYLKSNRTLAVATIGRDRTSLQAELELEQSNQP